MSKTESNAYTFGYALIFTAAVAVILALVATIMKPMQESNRENAKRVSILSTVTEVNGGNKDQVQAMFDESIEQVVIDANGNVLEGESAFNLDVAKEYKKDPSERHLPLYIYNSPDGGKSYVIPLRGSGLWGWISAFIALEDDLNTVQAAVFDHEGETPGLGAEIKSAEWFREQFVGKKFFDDSGAFVSIAVLKGRGNSLDEHSVDGVSGGTITSRGVDAMLERLQGYEAYFNSINS